MKKYFLFVTYTIIQSITNSEMCDLHLTHPSAHTHLEQWAANAVAPGEPRFEPTTSGYKSNALSISSRDETKYRHLVRDILILF